FSLAGELKELIIIAARASPKPKVAATDAANNAQRHKFTRSVISRSSRMSIALALATYLHKSHVLTRCHTTCGAGFHREYVAARRSRLRMSSSRLKIPSRVPTLIVNQPTKARH